MFTSIIPDTIHPDNLPRAEQLAAGLTSGALPTEQAAVALMLRLPHGVGLRDDVWHSFVLYDGETAAYTWPDLAEAATSGDLPLSRGERYLVRAACAIANPMLSTPLHQLAAALDPGCYDLLLAAMYHAAGRPNPAEQLAERDAEIGELRRRIEAYAVAEAALRDKLAALHEQVAAAVDPVRGTEDGNGEPPPDGVDGVHAGHHWPWQADDPATDEDCPSTATVPRSDQAGIGWRCTACGAAWSGNRSHPQPAPAPIGGAR